MAIVLAQLYYIDDIMTYFFLTTTGRLYFIFQLIFRVAARVPQYR